MKLFISFLALVFAPLWVPVYFVMVLLGKRETMEFEPSKPHRITQDDAHGVYVVLQRHVLFWNPCTHHGEPMTDWNAESLEKYVRDSR